MSRGRGENPSRKPGPSGGSHTQLTAGLTMNSQNYPSSEVLIAPRDAKAPFPDVHTQSETEPFEETDGHLGAAISSLPGADGSAPRWMDGRADTAEKRAEI